MKGIVVMRPSRIVGVRRKVEQGLPPANRLGWRDEKFQSLVGGFREFSMRMGDRTELGGAGIALCGG